MVLAAVTAIPAGLLALVLLLPPPAFGFLSPSQALEAEQPEAVGSATGQRLFEAHCVGCHVNGGNIIRRGKTLRLTALERNGVADPAAIATIAAEGVGVMSGYREALGEGGPEAVSDWVWEQALAGWPRS